MTRSTLRGWLALAATLLAGTLPGQVYTLDIEAPERGHFWAVGPLPLDAPHALIGLNGVRAYRLQALGDHSALYGFEAFGELVPDGPVQLVPAVIEDGLPLWWAHPAVVDDFDEVRGTLVVDGAEARTVSWTHVLETAYMQRFRGLYDCGDYVGSFWFDVFARSPVVQVSGFVARKDRAEADDVPLLFRFGEPVALPLERLHGGDLRLERGAIHGSLSMDVGTIYPIRFSLLCQNKPPAEVGPDAPRNLDDLSAEAIEAAENGPRWFIPVDWPAAWLGVEGVGRTEFGYRLARGAHQAWLESHEMIGLRPWASAPNPNQGGAQNSLGASFWLPVFVPIEFRPHEVMLWCSQDYALRPVHLFEPGSLAEPISSFPPRALTVARQIHGDGFNLGGQLYPSYQTKGSQRIALPNGKADVRSGHDEQHFTDASLLAAYAMTGDPTCRWLIDSHRGLDLAQKRPAAGWRNGARGEGRPMTWIVNAAALVGGDQGAALRRLSLLRLNNANDLATSVSIPADRQVRPLNAFSDPRLHCQQPAFVPYEEASLAWGAWRLWQTTGERVALESAYRYGLAVATQLLIDPATGSWSVPYGVYQNPDGRPWTSEQLRDPSIVHSSGWTIWWSGCGLRALVASANELGTRPGDEEFVDSARRALAWLDSQDPPSIDQAHHALHGVMAGSAR